MSLPNLVGKISSFVKELVNVDITVLGFNHNGLEPLVVDFAAELKEEKMKK